MSDNGSGGGKKAIFDGDLKMVQWRWAFTPGAWKARPQQPQAAEADEQPMTNRHVISGVAIVVLVLTARQGVFAHPGRSHRKPASGSSRVESAKPQSIPTDAQSASQWIFRVLSLDKDSAMDPLAVNDLPMLLAQREERNAKPGADGIPEMARAFAAFVKAKAVATRWDENYFYVESNGLPDHRMMVGITAWQQQVPLPQKYTGENAWRIPLRPVPAKKPQSTKGNFLRGAIALAANGIPIFNPLNNRGDDAYLFGELDEFGGHCGRADDYHYHLAPVHLQKVVGQGNPIAYALDGYPIYGYEEPDGSKVVGLDSLNGHKDADGNYHYHATKKYPYLNGGFFGEVIEREGQVDPQPRAEPLRPALQPMRGATITDFVESKPGSFRLTYEVGKRQGTVSYTLADDGSAKFEFVDPSEKKTSETYTPRRRGPGGNDRRPPPPPPRKGEKRGAQDDRRPTPPEEDRAAVKGRSSKGTKPDRKLPRLTLKSSSVDARGFLSIDCTCDGAGRSPAIEWSDAPAETKFFAISLWHTAPDQEKSYWLVYDIPADVLKLDTNSKSVGKLGLNDRRRAEYDPMCSKGPGVKTYHLTVFALSAEPDFGREKPNRASLLKAIQKITVAEETLDFKYERSGS